MDIVLLIRPDANNFGTQHDRHSARIFAEGGKFASGLHVDGALVGAAITGRPAADLLLGRPIRFVGLLDLPGLRVAPRDRLRNICALLVGLLLASVATFFRGQHRFWSIRHAKIQSTLGVLGVNEWRPRKTLLLAKTSSSAIQTGTLVSLAMELAAEFGRLRSLAVAAAKSNATAEKRRVE